MTQNTPYNRAALVAWVSVLFLAIGAAVIVVALAAGVRVYTTPVFTSTLPPTPTPGVLLPGAPALAPPAPDSTIPLLLPVSELVTATLPTGTMPTGTMHRAPTVTTTASPSPTFTSTLMPTATPTPTPRPPRPTRTAVTPSVTSSITPTPTLTLTFTSTPSPTSTPTATSTPTNTPTCTPTLSPARPPERIQIPAIELNAPVEPVSWETVEVDGQTYGRWQTPDRFAAGWHNTSAGVGQAGNTVLNGHHNINGGVFMHLVKVEPGDSVVLTAGDYSYQYVVVQTMTLPEQDQSIETRLENARWILPTDDERVTLVTCWPLGGNSHRLIVVARPVEEVYLESRWYLLTQEP